MSRDFHLWVTFGPALDDDEVIREVIRAGATGARFNFSYGTTDLNFARARRFRDVAATLGRAVDTIADIAGDKIRIAALSGGERMSVSAGAAIVIRGLESSPSNDYAWIALSHWSNLLSAQPGEELIFGDGSVVLTVVTVTNASIECRVSCGGDIEVGRGVLLRGSTFAPASLTDKDLSDLKAIADTDL
ncbi:MAG TPA: pyruvate kinase, partial [Thermoanaerobaculia bacterium]